MLNIIGLNAEVRYKLLAQSTQNLFSINAESGKIFAKEPLDREKQDQYWISIFANDLGKPISLNSTAKIYINILDLNDNPPQASCQMMNISSRCRGKDDNGNNVFDFDILEEQKGGTFVGKISATDLDEGENAQIKYQISKIEKLSLNHVLGEQYFETQQDITKFLINAQNGEISSSTKLDREEAEKYKLIIKINDGGLPSLTSTVTAFIHVLGINEHEPIFTFPSRFNNTVKLFQSIGLHSIITKVEAIDKDEGQDGQVFYRLKLSNSKEILNLLKIDELSGEIKLARPLNLEDAKFYEIQLEAYDKGNPPKFTEEVIKIIIDKAAIINFHNEGNENANSNQRGDTGKTNYQNYGRNANQNNQKSKSFLDSIEEIQTTPLILKICLIGLIFLMLFLTLVLIFLFLKGQFQRKSFRAPSRENQENFRNEVPKLLSMNNLFYNPYFKNVIVKISN